MIDKQLLRLLGNNKKYIFYTVSLMIIGLLANICITASICQAIYRAANYNPQNDSIGIFLIPALPALIGIAIRYFTTRFSGNLKDLLSRKVKKEIREKLYDKILRLGIRSTDDMSMAGLTQVSMEGIEQLDLYYSSYIPQFFYAILAPVILFVVTVWIDWQVAFVLLACVPLIPISIIAVSRYAKKIFAKYWDKYTSMGDSFLDSVQGLRELKIFKADEAQHIKMNQNAEEFRKITMKVLVTQLASTTIMDLVAYGGAGIGISVAVMGVINRGLSPITALFLILVAVDFFLPLRAFGSAFHIAMNGASAGRKILSLLEQPDPIWGEEEVTGTEIKMEDVTFSYDGKRDVLKNIHMTFAKTGMTSIVGASGCGKSTVVGLLCGSLHPQTGNITVGGKAIETLSRDNYYRHIAVVSFNTYIFNETVRANFMLANKDVTEDKIFEALQSDILLDETKKMKQKITNAGAATEFIVSIIIIATLACGIALVAGDLLSAGRMVIGVVNIFGSFGPVIAISALPSNLTQTFASGDRVLDLLSEKPAVTPVKDGQIIDFEDLSVSDLSFSYDGQTEVLRDICMQAKKGEIIGITGESGCGKSTFLKLLLRFWQKESGRIDYNGFDIDTVDTDSLLDNVTMVSQTTYLFDETIENNLRIAKPDATMQEIENACKLASVHDFILTLPDGYQSRAGALGDNLSAGEKQRIGLARAFLRGSALILLDEPTSNVDSINEGIILKALKEQKHRKSIILVSHRASTMSIADRIYRVEKGRMYEQAANEM